VAEVTTDDMLVDLWLHGRPPHTVRAYRFEWGRFLAHASGRELPTVRLRHVQEYLGSLAALSPNSQRRAQAALKSLFSFAVRVGYLPANLGAFLHNVAAKDTLSERILDAATVHRVIAVEPATRNRAMLRLLYAAGLRVSELCGLKWRDLAPRDDAGQVTVYGKGGKTRAVLLSAATWRELQGVRSAAAVAGDPVFPSQKGGGHLDPSAVLRIVKQAAARAGVGATISPHWFRHAHASHALDRGCPISLVQATLGHATVTTTGRYLHARPGDSSARYLGV
jgi:integrase/recombinase XerD